MTPIVIKKITLNSFISIKFYFSIKQYIHVPQYAKLIKWDIEKNQH